MAANRIIVSTGQINFGAGYAQPLVIVRQVPFQIIAWPSIKRLKHTSKPSRWKDYKKEHSRSESCGSVGISGCGDRI
ncbi:hypothetical protein MESS2_1520011 [Mesorhizobium metallidurans STM 2683]|uniref:Uncharacterized protein n=1 Tax=Mesorhizobium metallidurans STM 2683 TaxID=1297569 RepID=M5ELL2_9HYPH|nr:hypothetical protein MESS2_1520011 [Mesorhizobium metallidurans STM 2683]